MKNIPTGALKDVEELFAIYNRDGARMEMTEGPNKLDFGVIDGIQIIRSKTSYDGKSKAVDLVFWVMFREIGYQNGFQYVHSFKVMEWVADGSGKIVLTDDTNRQFTIDLLRTRVEQMRWSQWKGYKAMNLDVFDYADEVSLEEHLGFAERWK